MISGLLVLGLMVYYLLSMVSMMIFSRVVFETDQVVANFVGILWPLVFVIMPIYPIIIFIGFIIDTIKQAKRDRERWG